MKPWLSKTAGTEIRGGLCSWILGDFLLRFLLLKILALSHAHLFELVKKLAERSRVRLLKSQTLLSPVLCSNGYVEVFERHISMQGRLNDFKLRIGLDASEDPVEASVVSDRKASVRSDAIVLKFAVLLPHLPFCGFKLHLHLFPSDFSSYELLAEVFIMVVQSFFDGSP